MTPHVTDSRDRIIVALDFPDVTKANTCVEQLNGVATYVKVGMELYYRAGEAFIYTLKEQGFKVFLDLKLHDIPNTVRGAARSLTRLEVDMFNVHAMGGIKMMDAAREGILQEVRTGMTTPLLIAVTVLTSTDQSTMNDELHIHGTVENHVLHLAHMSKHAGLDGVVASPLEVGLIKETLGAPFITVTPGIRPFGVAVNDQKRVTTPEEAIRLGTDYIVVGRAITAAEDPQLAYENIRASLQNSNLL